MAQFSLFDSPIDLSHSFWEKLLCTSDKVIDATLGHGYDAMHVLKLIPEGFLYGFDIQKEAIDSTNMKLAPFFHNFKLFHQSHESFPHEIKKESIKLIIYNLGYLPKGNKELTTQAESTKQSLNHALNLLCPSGAISIMIYTGHEAGEREEQVVLEWAHDLNKTDYLVTFHKLINRHKAPALCVVQKKIKGVPDECCG